MGLAAASALSWWVWLAWWLLDEAAAPSASGWLVAGDLVTLVIVVVLGDLRVGRWWGPVLAVVPHAAVAFWPIARSDPFGAAIWVLLSLGLLVAAAITSVVLAVPRCLRERHRT
ncbi:hypothetical protein [Kineococcus sp. SYSU DK005]|uniref:hypothetical protein n=1 Tax=Kineococcus sp. SYSU DK005 TaxID=3383126 RepID=UPI003D7D6E97